MGKVGSSTVYRTLVDLGLPGGAVQTHTLDAVHLSHAKRRARASSSRVLPTHLIVATFLARRLERRPPLRIVTLTRDPVARAVSFVFEDWRKQLGDGVDRRAERIDTTRATKRVVELLAGESGTADPTTWFDRELRGLFGIDVFATPFDPEVGYGRYRATDGTELLLLRVEDLDRTLAPALAPFVGVDGQRITLRRDNRGTGKWYGPALEEVKRTLVLPESVVDHVIGSRYFAHFYGREAGAALRRRWTVPRAEREESVGRRTRTEPELR